MGNFCAPKKITGWNQGIYQESATQKEMLGTVRELIDGRKFAYAKNGAGALAAGKLTQGAVWQTTQLAQAVNTAAIGDTSLTVTVTNAVTADQYKDGFIWVSDDTGEGNIYEVLSNTAASGGEDSVFYLKGCIRVAFADATTVTMYACLQNGVIICPTALTAAPAGVPLIPVTASYYFWNQVKGPCPVLIDGTVAIGEEVAPSNTTAGAVEALVHATTLDTTVGVAMTVDASTEYGLINLAIPGY